uniref:Uncharacterized protein n=1 Tax=Arundo donax TaxID=35708 RepID=A0A0A9EN24_ARUDO
MRMALVRPVLDA